MKSIGLVLVAIGIVLGAWAFTMDTAVETPSQTIGSSRLRQYIPSVYINNIGFMEDRRNYMMGSGLFIVVGAILIGFGSLKKGH